MLTHLLQKILVLRLLIGLSLNSWGQKEIDIKSFELSVMPYLIWFREMHVVLIQKNGWKQRLQMAKGMKVIWFMLTYYRIVTKLAQSVYLHA